MDLSHVLNPLPLTIEVSAGHATSLLHLPGSLGCRLIQWHFAPGS
ncbi:hypothetical protein [Thermogemmatispora sp.]